MVSNKMPPAMHVLPAGALNVRLPNPMENFSGDFVHSGGWLIIHADNSCEINLVDCFEKKEINAGLIKVQDLGSSVYTSKIQ